MTTPPPRSTLFPYTTLFRSRGGANDDYHETHTDEAGKYRFGSLQQGAYNIIVNAPNRACEANDSFFVATGKTSIAADLKLDRKSTRLNSSHQIISYAVFCLK